MANRTERATKNLYFGIVSKMVNIFFPFVVRTVLIYKIGMEYAGLSSLFTSVLSVLSLSELGVGTAMVYSMYEPVAQNDEKKLCCILNLYRTIYRIIGTVILILGLACLPFISKLVTGDCPEDINLKIVYLVYLINTVVSYYLFSYKQSLLSAYMREDVNSKIRTFVYVFLYTLQIASLLTFENYYAYVIILPISTVLNNIMLEIYARRIIPNVFCSGQLSKKEKKGIFKNIFSLAGHKFGEVLTSSFDNIIISSVLGLTALAIFSNYFYIHTAVISCFLVLDQVLIPIIGNRIVSENEDSNYQLMLKLQFIYVWIVIWCAICMLCLYQPTITIWVGIENTVSTFELIAFVVYFLCWKINSIMALYKTAAGLWVQDKFRPYYSSILNLLLNIVLVKYIGMAGVLLSTIIIFITITIPIENHVTFNSYFKRSPKQYYLNMTKYLLAFIALSAITYFLCGLITIQGIPGLLLKLLICVLFPNIGFAALFYRTDGFIYLVGIISKIINKVKHRVY